MKGFLLIDGSYNTLFIPCGDFPDFEHICRFNKDWIKGIKQHRTRAELNAEISDYIKMRGDYSNES